MSQLRQHHLAAASAALLLAAIEIGATRRAAIAYPLDAFPDTGITRLEGYRRAQQGEVEGAFLLPRGALWPSSRVRLRLLDHANLDLPAPDERLGAALTELVGRDAPSYSLALLDLTDPEHPRYGEHNADAVQNPGSVGKLMVVLALLQQLADLYPDDVEARRRVLRETEIVANAFIRNDDHTVPIWQPGDHVLVRRQLHEGDRGNLWTYLDWMCSSSSNAAASVVMSELVLMKHFGKKYPVPMAEGDAFLSRTPKGTLTSLLLDGLLKPLDRNGLDRRKLRQGSLFTKEGKRRIPGTDSAATARQLMLYLLRMEEGRLVDRFSSEEIKRLLYVTERRIRYAASSALFDAGVFYKSGTFFRCKPEAGFVCRNYQGNLINYMHSTAVVETEGDPHTLPVHYMVVLMSNVLRKDSALVHESLAAQIHHLVEDAHRK